MSYSQAEQELLLSVAKQSIDFGLTHQRPMVANEMKVGFPNSFVQPRGTFVTLEKNGQLRGCIGSLQAVRPLADDVAINAFKSAFNDPRFQPLTEEEVDALHISISVLTPPVLMEGCTTYQALLDQLVPNEDGLIISDGQRRATFLPSVWKQLPDKSQFIAHLMQKAGMRQWPANMRCERYHSFAFGQNWQDISELPERSE